MNWTNRTGLEMHVPAEIGPEEELGRSVFSSRHANRALRSTVPHHVFLTSEGQTRISVDRLSVASQSEALALAQTAAADRGRTFYGWAAVSAKAARANGRDVVATPIPDRNPYHGDIVLPDSATVDREEQTRHAQELADASHWRPCPNPDD